MKTVIYNKKALYNIYEFQRRNITWRNTPVDLLKRFSHPVGNSSSAIAEPEVYF